jgi:hypothetical protein
MDHALFSEFDPEIAEFWQYWRRLPKIDLVPHLRDYLDNVPPKLQPSVALIDVSGPDTFTLRLAGTAIIEAIGGEPAEPNTLPVYNSELRKAAAATAWVAANKPCGYAAKRYIRSKAGRLSLVHGIALPLRTDRPNCKTLVNFSSLARTASGMDTPDQMESMQALQPVRWIDIGNGIPPPP